MALIKTAGHGPAPIPRPLPAPSHVERSRSASPAAADRIERPRAEPSPGSANLDPPAAGATLPVFAAAGLLAAGAAVVLAPLDAAGAVAGAARTGSDALGRGSGFVNTALRDAAARYRAGAAEFTKLDLRDPHVVGTTLGAQTWNATEEIVRGAVSGAALAGGAWAVDRIGAAAAQMLTGVRKHDPGR